MLGRIEEFSRLSPLPYLEVDEPDPVMIGHADGGGPFFLAADHAGRALPRRLGDLGISAAELARHIGWDIGIWGVSLHLAKALDAFLIGQAYSRLVIDCNRPPDNPTAIPQVSESTVIPGNAVLTAAEREARRAGIFAPYHERIVRELDRRAAMPTMYVAMHSMTNVYKGVARPWHVAVLYNNDRGFGRVMLEALRAEGDLVVGENEPYTVSAVSDYSAPVHAERRGLPYLELEIRQDLIAGEAGQIAWAARLARLLPKAWATFNAE
jgi:predicted N-formylglutamate amidohydrolase